MRTKTIVIIGAALLAIGGIIGMHSGDCPMKDVKPCQMFKSK